MKWVAAQGLGTLGAYIGLPFGAILMFAVLPATGFLILLQDEPAWLKWACFTACAGLVYGLLIWLVYVQPRGDHLALHSEGFRIKITFKRRRVLFCDLKSITFGLDSKVFRSLTGALGVLNPDEAAGLRHHASTAMKLQYHDGATVVFKSFLHRFDPEDLQKFLNFVAEKCPWLFAWAKDDRGR